MEVFYGPNYKISENTVIAFGKFDGIHKGHIKLIDILTKEAKENSLISVIYTFDRHPRVVLDNENIKLLTDNDTKIEKLKSLGVDVVVFEQFDKQFADKLPEEFVYDVLIKKLNMKRIVIGSNSRFGKDSKGDLETLKKLALEYEFEVVEVPLLLEQGKVISSSEIRKELGVKGGAENEIF